MRNAPILPLTFSDEPKKSEEQEKKMPVMGRMMKTKETEMEQTEEGRGHIRP